MGSRTFSSLQFGIYTYIYIRQFLIKQSILNRAYIYWTGMLDTHKPNTIKPTSIPTRPKQTQNPKIPNQIHTENTHSE